MKQYFQLGRYSADLTKPMITEVQKVYEVTKLDWAPSRVLDFASGYGCTARHMRHVFVPHVAVLGTALFHDLPAAAAMYGIDPELAEKWHIRRYGFHGNLAPPCSANGPPSFWGKPWESLNQIVLHLGNGASASAIAGGRPVDTSMGLTPLEGLVMGTRSGDIDASIVGYLHREAEMSVDDIESMLNQHSGMLGRAGERDFRRLQQMIESGDSSAQLAYYVFIHRLRKYIGAYLAILGPHGCGELHRRDRRKRRGGPLRRAEHADGTGHRDR